MHTPVYRELTAMSRDTPRWLWVEFCSPRHFMLLRMLTATTKMTPVTAVSSRPPISRCHCRCNRQRSRRVSCDVCLIAPRHGVTLVPCVRVAFGARTCSATRTWLSACRRTRDADARLRSAPGPPRLSIAHHGINDSLSFSVWTIAHAWINQSAVEQFKEFLTDGRPTPELV